jgi:hypothetical protein
LSGFLPAFSDNLSVHSSRVKKSKEDWINLLWRNVGKKTPFYDVQNPKRVQISYTPWRPEITQECSSATCPLTTHQLPVSTVAVFVL